MCSLAWHLATLLDVRALLTFFSGHAILWLSVVGCLVATHIGCVRHSAVRAWAGGRLTASAGVTAAAGVDSQSVVFYCRLQ